MSLSICIKLDKRFLLMVLIVFSWFNMGRITKNDRCLIKTIKTENITHIIVSSQSIAVNK